MTNRTSAFLVTFLTIFIDLLGFGIIIPIVPHFLKNILQEPESIIGITVGIYTPVWGSLSDVYGRKPILIMSLSGNVISYILMALAFSGLLPSMTLLVISRALAGIFSANLSAAQSVVSDLTSKEERARGMGIIGAAFGLGFVIGPALGGVLSFNFGYSVPVLVSAGFSAIALILCITIFKETLSPEVQKLNQKNFKGVTLVNIKGIKDILSNKKVGVFIIIFFFITFSFANIHATFLLFAERKDGLNMSEQGVGLLLSYLGIVASFVQGLLIKFFKKWLGEEKSLITGNLITAVGLALIPLSNNLFILLIVLFILAFGNGLNNPMVLGLISENTEQVEQGSVLGVNQAMGSLARFLGPVWGGIVFQSLGYQFPFWSGAFFMTLITIFSFRIIKNS